MNQMIEVETFAKKMMDKRKKRRERKELNPHLAICGVRGGSYDSHLALALELLKISHDESCCIHHESPLGIYGHIYCDCSQRDYVLAEYYLLGLQPEFWAWFAENEKESDDFRL